MNELLSAIYEFNKTLPRRYKIQLYCQCKNENRARFVLKLKKGKVLMERYFYSGPTHDEQCPHYEPMLTEKQGSTPAVRRDEDGTIHVSLKMPKTRIQALTAEETSTPRQTTRQYRAAFRTLLYHLLDEANINQWNPKLLEHRYARWLIIKMKAVVNKFIVNGVSLREQMFIPDYNQFLKNHETLDALLKEAKSAGNRCFICGELAGIMQERDDSKLKIHSMSDSGYLHMDNDAFELFKKRFLKTVYKNQKLDPLFRYILFGIVSRDASGRFWLSHPNVIWLTTRYIPVESKYELCFEQYLVNNKRHFRRPLIPSIGRRYIVDFDLLDTKYGVYPFEVWGRKDQYYRQLKAKKVQYYKRQALPLGEWDAVSRKPLPPLPPFA